MNESRTPSPRPASTGNKFTRRCALTALLGLLFLLTAGPLLAEPRPSFLLFYSSNIQGEIAPCG
jgi:hypothetical protein